MRARIHLSVAFLLLLSLLTMPAKAQFGGIKLPGGIKIPPIPGLPGGGKSPLPSLTDPSTLLNDSPLGRDAITTSIKDATGEVPYLDEFTPLTVSSIFSLSKDEAGSFLVKPGAYAGAFRSFCLHAGTHFATHGNGYVTAPLKGPKARLVSHILQKYGDHPDIPQGQIQALIWAIESHADLQSMSSPMRQTAIKVLSDKNGVPSAGDLFDLSGGVMQVIPTQQFKGMLQKVTEAERPIYVAQNEIRRISAAGNSYADMARLAVLPGDPPPDENAREIPGGRWVYDAKSGVFLNFAPSGYPRTQTEVYCPEPFIIRYDQAGRIREIEAGDHGYKLATSYQDTPAGETTLSQRHPISSIALSFSGKVVFKTALTGDVLTGDPTGAEAATQKAVAHYQQIQAMQQQFIGNSPRTLTNLVINLTNYRESLSLALSDVPNKDARLLLNDFVSRAWIATAYQWINEDKLAVQPVHVSFVPKQTVSPVATFRLTQGIALPLEVWLVVTVGALIAQHAASTHHPVVPTISFDPGGYVATPANTGAQRLGQSRNQYDNELPPTTHLPFPFNLILTLLTHPIVLHNQGNPPNADTNDPFGGRPNKTPAGGNMPAPGMPGEEDGYVPPKNWDGRKVPNPNGSGYGVPDKSGNVWVPTGPDEPGNAAHGGPHWDVQKPGGGYTNVKPSGGGFKP